jgi:hypothetical protein
VVQQNIDAVQSMLIKSVQIVVREGLLIKRERHANQKLCMPAEHPRYAGCITDELQLLAAL